MIKELRLYLIIEYIVLDFYAITVIEVSRIYCVSQNF